MDAPDTEPDPASVDALFDRLQDLAEEQRERELASPDLDPRLVAAVRKLLALVDALPSSLDQPIAPRVELTEPRPPESIGPYEILGEIGSGGMGVVYRARQARLGRDVAVKVLRSALQSPDAARRFAREAEFLGRLQHRGIAQIYEAGVAELAAGDAAYIVMELVDGVPLSEFLASRTLDLRARVELLIELAEATHHAHTRGVIHRDLKPTNVLVASDGGVKVIDFGVARATSQETEVATLPGQVVGTLAYMSPEQLRGENDQVDTRTDVFALGTIAYETFAGRLPHEVTASSVPVAVSTLLERTPERLGRVAPECRGDLELIVEHALEKEPDRRYQSAAGFAADLRRLLDGDPVVARPPSALYQARRLASRHRGAAVGLGATLLAILIGAAVATRYAVVNARLASSNENLARLATERAEEAERLQGLAEERAIQIERRSDADRLDRTLREADALWPPVPATIPAIDEWLEDLGEPLANNLAPHRAGLEELRTQAEPYDAEQERIDRETHPLLPQLEEAREDLELTRAAIDGQRPKLGNVDDTAIENQIQRVEQLEATIAALEAGVGARRTWRFSDPDLQERHDDLARLVERLEEFTDEQTGTLADVRERRALALALQRRTLETPAAREAWEAAIAAIRSSPHYGGLELAPQAGLLPLREDPRSGLWEFWHVMTGDEPRLRAEPTPASPWELTKDTGVVLVLIPGGPHRIGAQSEDATLPHFDPLATPFEGPVREVDTPPFFVSKYELTQSQYLRITDGNPSGYAESFRWSGNPPGDVIFQANTWWNPVEFMPWTEATDAVERVALRLPSLVEWEIAARGGTSTPWWTGASGESLADAGGLPAGNFGDALTRERGGPDFFSVTSWGDEFVTHASVGEFAPNPFGLFDVLGNVGEFCSDHGIDYAGENVVAARGGTYQDAAEAARVTLNVLVYDNDKSNRLGIRPARSVD